MLRSSTLFVGLVAAMLAGAASALAEDTTYDRAGIRDAVADMSCQACCRPKCLQPPDCSCSKRLHVRIDVGAWIPANFGSSTIRGETTDVDVSLVDIFSNLDRILEKLDFTMMSGIALEYGKWELGFDLFVFSLGSTGDVTLLRDRTVPASIDVDERIYQLTLKYQLACCPGPRVCNKASIMKYDVLAGARVYDMGMDLTLGPAPKLSASRTWVDPIVGARARWYLGRRWVFGAEANIGGFGVGSDLSWELRLAALYRVNTWFGIAGGWRFLDVDYSSGTGANRFAWDIFNQGPYIGVQFRI